MKLYPAIDLRGGQAVRLYQGDYDQMTVYNADPVAQAHQFIDAGAKYLHVVDLDGAKEGRPVNQHIYEDVAAKTGLKVEVGGGIRNLETIDTYLKSGVERVILGSAALKNPKLVKNAVQKFGSQHIAVGIDAKNGMVATEGWLEESDTDYITLAKEMIAVGVQYFIVTDIAKDGTLSGVNLKQLKDLRDATNSNCNIIASGGVHTIEDIRGCKKLGLYGTICGKSIYKGTLDLKEAIALAEGV